MSLSSLSWLTSLTRKSYETNTLDQIDRYIENADDSSREPKLRFAVNGDQEDKQLQATAILHSAMVSTGVGTTKNRYLKAFLALKKHKPRFFVHAPEPAKKMKSLCWELIVSAYGPGMQRISGKFLFAGCLGSRLMGIWEFLTISIGGITESDQQNYDFFRTISFLIVGSVKIIHFRQNKNWTEKVFPWDLHAVC